MRCGSDSLEPERSKVGARWLLIVGPALVAAGFALLGSAEGSYWIALAAMTVLGFGMGLAVAPLTTTVINAVPPHRTGVASGINNAVASVGGLLLIAILGSVALVAFGHALGRNLSIAHASRVVKAVVDSARGGFVVPGMAASLATLARQQAHDIIARSLVVTIRMAMWAAAVLAVAGALTAALTVRSDERRRGA